MLIGGGGVFRAAWYDRNGEGILQRSTFITGPHGATNRISYTIPVGRNAWLDSMQINLRRTTSPITLGDVLSQITYTPNGGAELNLCERTGRFPAVDDKEEFFTTALGLFFTGDILKVITSDVSIGGTVDYNIALRFTLFDA